MRRVLSIAANTYREAIRDRVLYNLILFAFLLIGAAILFGTISVGVESIIMVTLGLSSILVFGLMMATLLVLIVVPALVAIQADVGRLFGRTAPAAGVSPARSVRSAAPGR